jgi:hypothetical protein
MPLLDELSGHLATRLGLTETERREAVSATAQLLSQRFGIDTAKGTTT